MRHNLSYFTYCIFIDSPGDFSEEPFEALTNYNDSCTADLLIKSQLGCQRAVDFYVDTLGYLLEVSNNASYKKKQYLYCLILWGLENDIHHFVCTKIVNSAVEPN